jgi:hypothetical protein
LAAKIDNRKIKRGKYWNKVASIATAKTEIKPKVKKISRGDIGLCVVEVSINSCLGTVLIIVFMP